MTVSENEEAIYKQLNKNRLKLYATLSKKINVDTDDYFYINDGINIYIGDENEFDSNVTVVKSTYNVNGQKGTIAIIGPKRMEYDKVVGLLSYITKNLESHGDE